MRPRDGLDDGAVEHRHQRRALPAGRHVGGAEVVHHRDAEPLRQRETVAHLDGEAGLRLVDHGLAVKADHGDVGRRDVVFRHQALDRLGVGARGQRLGLADHARPRAAIGERHRLGQRLPQQGALVVGKGAIGGRTEGCDALAVGLDDGGIHPVERGAAHQPNGTDNGHPFTPPAPAVESDAGPVTPPDRER